MRSPKFLSADGGYSRVVWMPSDLKQQMKEFIPAELIDCIATEKDAQTPTELKDFLIPRSHPVCRRWDETGAISSELASPANPVLIHGDIPISAGGFKIIFKNARIFSDKVTIIPVKPKKQDKKDAS
jgi:acetyl-CoA decarbonylase/synthase complex subunit beta